MRGSSPPPPPPPPLPPPPPPIVKVCGVSTREHALAVAAAGADLLGLIFVAGSPRCVSVQRAKAIVAAVRDAATTTAFASERPHQALLRAMKQPGAGDVSVQRWLRHCAAALRTVLRATTTPLIVGVFMDDDMTRVNAIADELDLDFIQLHGSESAAEVALAVRPVIQVVHVKDSADGSGAETDYDVILERIHRCGGGAVAVLLDTCTGGGASGGTGKVFDWEVAKKINQMVRGIRALLGASRRAC